MSSELQEVMKKLLALRQKDFDSFTDRIAGLMCCFTLPRNDNCSFICLKWISLTYKLNGYDVSYYFECENL